MEKVYKIMATTKSDRLGRAPITLQRCYEGDQQEVLLNVIDMINSSRFVYDYDNHVAVNTETINTIYTQAVND